VITWKAYCSISIVAEEAQRIRKTATLTDGKACYCHCPVCIEFKYIMATAKVKNACVTSACLRLSFPVLCCGIPPVGLRHYRPWVRGRPERLLSFQKRVQSCKVDAKHYSRLRLSFVVQDAVQVSMWWSAANPDGWLASSAGLQDCRVFCFCNQRDHQKHRDKAKYTNRRSRFRKQIIK